MNFSESVSALQVPEELKTDHPLLTQTQGSLHKIDVDQKEIVLMCVPGLDGIRGDERAHWAAKEAYDKETTDDYLPFCGPKTLDCQVYIYIV